MKNEGQHTQRGNGLVSLKAGQEANSFDSK